MCLYNNKDPIPLRKRQDVVYLLRCINCPNPGAFYIGQTKRCLHIRLSEHDRDCKKNVKTTALAAHSTDHGHKFDLDNVKVLATENNTNKRLILEKCYIRAFGVSAINFQRDSENLSRVYDAVFSKD